MEIACVQLGGFAVCETNEKVLLVADQNNMRRVSPLRSYGRIAYQMQAAR